MSIGEFSKRREDRLAIVLEDLLAVLIHHRMQKWSGGDDDGRAVRMFDGGPVLHDGTDVHHVFPVLVDGAAQQADERLVGHDLLSDGVDEKAGVDDRLA